MSVHTIAIIAAGIGVLFSIAWVVLGTLGVRSLREIGAQLRRQRH